MFDAAVETGVDRISDNASIRFDFPAAFGPMRMFRFSNSRVAAAGPKERKFSSVTCTSGRW